LSGLEARIVGAGYGRLKIIAAAELKVEPGALLTILGSNGAGKSTLLRALVGKAQQSSRTLSLRGVDLSHLPSWRLAHNGLVFVPDGARCFGSLTVEENLRAAHQLIHPGASRAALASMLEEVHAIFPVLAQNRGLRASAFSGGQRQMLAVGRALMAQPKALILDEPSAGLSPKVAEEMFLALGKIKQSRDCSILMAEQNVALASMVADECIVLEEGRVMLKGKMSMIVQDERLRSIYLGI
jgi:branched-chain amino acid transport system ATP-binding protein